MKRSISLTMRGSGLLAVVLLAGCTSSVGDPKDPSRALEPRDTALEHEPCDLEDSEAKTLDANGDGRPDIVRVYDGSREVCRAIDINMDTVIDVFVYFDERGQERRRESGFDRDTLPDEIAYLQNGVIVRKERETNNDRKIDTWDHYENGSLTRSERDSTGDGFIDQWWSYNRPDNLACAVVTIDEDGDGKPEPDTALDICADEDAANAATAAIDRRTTKEPETEDEAGPEPGEAEGDDDQTPSDEEGTPPVDAAPEGAPKPDAPSEPDEAPGGDDYPPPESEGGS